MNEKDKFDSETCENETYSILPFIPQLIFFCLDCFLVLPKSIGLCFCNENGVRHTLDILLYSFYVRGLFLVEWGLKIAVLANPKLLSASIHDLYFFVTCGFLAFITF